MLMLLAVLSWGMNAVNFYFERAGSDPGSLVPRQVYLESNSDKRWQLLEVELSRTELSQPLSFGLKSLERVKELIYISELYAPEEADGSDEVPMNSYYVKYLSKYYPDIDERKPGIYGKLRLGFLHSIIMHKQPSFLSLVMAGVEVDKSDNQK